MEKFVISGERKISHQDILQNAAKAARGLRKNVEFQLRIVWRYSCATILRFLKCLWPPLHWVLTQCR